MPGTVSQQRRYAFFLTSYFVQGSIGIIYEPLNYILKDHLHLTPGQASGFIAWMTFPLLLKPLYGFVTDFVPIAGYRRKPHLLLAALASSLAFFGLAAQTHYRYAGLLGLMTLSILAMAFADVVCGGWLVEDGKRRQETGPYQALHIGGLYLSAVAVGAGGGWMTSHLPFSWIFGIAGGLPLAMITASLFVREEKNAPRVSDNAGSIWTFLRTKQFLALSMTIFLWNFYPFLGTVQFYYQSSVLHLTPQWIGSLMTIGSIAGLAGSAVFWKFCRGKNSSVWVHRAPLMMAGVSLTYLFYLGPVSVTGIETLYGFSTVFFRLALLDLVARSCPVDAEATFYAIFLAFFDIAMYASNAAGGKLYDFAQAVLSSRAHHDQLSAALLIVIGSLCTLACRWTLKYCRTATS